MDRIRTVAAIALLSFMAALCTLPGLLLLRYQGETVSATENRTLAALPSLPPDLAGVAVWPGRFEDFVADHFGWRSAFVRGYNLLHLKAGVSPQRRVVVGKAGWLFLEQTRLGEQNRGADPLGAAELDRLVASFEARHRYLAARGIGFVVLPAPDKNSLYPEYLPDSLKIVGPSRLEQFRQAARGAGFQLVDTLAALETAKDAGEKPYYRTDSHWNCRGAWIAYRALMADVRAAGYHGGRTLEESDVEFTQRVHPRGSDIVRNLLNLEGLIEEPYHYLCRVRDGATIEATRPDDGLAFDYPYAAPPGKEHRRYRRDPPRDHSRVLVYRDSYANAMLRFLVHSFDEVVYAAPPRPLGFDPADIDRYRPDLVIYQFVERSFHHPPDNHLLEPSDALNARASHAPLKAPVGNRPAR